jgi:hypothetical protein
VCLCVNEAERWKMGGGRQQLAYVVKASLMSRGKEGAGPQDLTVLATTT